MSHDEIQEIVSEFRHIMDCTNELVDHFGAAFLWLLDYAKKNNIAVDDTFGFHISRIRVLLGEIADAPGIRLADRISNLIETDRNPPPDKLPVYL